MLPCLILFFILVLYLLAYLTIEAKWQQHRCQSIVHLQPPPPPPPPPLTFLLRGSSLLTTPISALFFLTFFLPSALSWSFRRRQRRTIWNTANITSICISILQTWASVIVLATSLSNIHACPQLYPTFYRTISNSLFFLCSFIHSFLLLLFYYYYYVVVKPPRFSC